MTYLHAEDQGERSVDSKDREYTNGWRNGRMVAIALPGLLMWLEINFHRTFMFSSSACNTQRPNFSNV